MPRYVQVVTTTDSEQHAQTMATALVERRLAACVQIVGPITSVYRWQGQIETAREWQCWAKSRGELYDNIERAIRELHHYDEPEILAIGIETGSPSYLAWLDEQVAGN